MRGTTAERGYGGDHRKWRERVLARDKVCRDPHGRHGSEPPPATVADHILPLEDSGTWDLDNGQGLCAGCHSIKTNDETTARRRTMGVADNKNLPQIRELLLDLGDGFQIWRVSPVQLKEQDKNARVQSPRDFKALVRNIKKRGALESLPFCALTDGVFWIISGHHRVRAAIQAELPSIVVLVDTSPRTRAEIVAKQVAHNSINGKDDAAVLLQLLAEIDDVDAMIESAVDKGELEKLVRQNVSVPDVQVDYDWSTVTFAFLPTQVKDLTQLCESVGASDLVGTADKKIHDEFVATMRRLGKQAEIRSVGAMLYRMMEIVKQHLDAESGTKTQGGGE